MGLTVESVKRYLASIDSLKDINNDDVSYQGDKTGQTPLAIEYAQKCIKELIKGNKDKTEVRLLKKVTASLSMVPTSLFDISAIYNVLSDLDSIQKDLIDTVNSWMLHEKLPNEKRLPLVKAMVLILKILEYDLNKPGDVIRGKYFFKFTVLSDADRVVNQEKVVDLLQQVIFLEDEAVNSLDNETQAVGC
jgi:hypothetical protein